MFILSEIKYLGEMKIRCIMEGRFLAKERNKIFDLGLFSQILKF